MKKGATIASVSLLALSLAFLIESPKLPFGKVSAPAAGFFPAVLAALLALISLLAVLDALRADAAGAAHSEGLIWKKIIWTVGSLLAFVIFFESLGYLPATFLFVMFLLRAVERTSWALVLTVALSASLVSNVMFGLLLKTPLPAGFLRI